MAWACCVLGLGLLGTEVLGTEVLGTGVLGLEAKLPSRRHYWATGGTTAAILIATGVLALLSTQRYRWRFWFGSRPPFPSETTTAFVGVPRRSGGVVVKGYSSDSLREGGVLVMEPGTQMDRRLREIRAWRQLSVRAVAELSGISFGYLAKIERGEKPIENRRVLEALAATLKVSPAELTGKPYLPVDDDSAEVRASMAAIEDALTGWWLGEMPDAPSRSWQDVSADVTRLNTVLRPEAALTEQAVLLPHLIRDLLAAAGDPKHGRSALVGLIGAYKSAAYLAHDLGFAGLPTLAVERMRQAAEALGDPAEYADVSWRRAQLLSGANRRRQYEIATAVADAPDAYPHVRGMANLTAALSAASRGIEDTGGPPEP